MIKMLGPLRETKLVFPKGRSNRVEFIESPILNLGSTVTLNIQTFQCHRDPTVLIIMHILN